LFQRAKKKLAALCLDGYSLKKTLKSVIRTIPTDEFITAFGQWFGKCEKCILNVLTSNIQRKVENAFLCSYNNCVFVSVV
jgi:hypothetical protein